jgi:hypothetical protein
VSAPERSNRAAARKKGLEEDAFLFLQEACSEMKTSTPPAFAKSVASSWARLSQGRATPEITVAHRPPFRRPSHFVWKLGHAGNLTHSILETSLHRLDYSRLSPPEGLALRRIPPAPGGQRRPLEKEHGNDPDARA